MTLAPESPLPWKFYIGGPPDSKMVMDAEGQIVGFLDFEPVEKRERILGILNAFPALVEVLKKVEWCGLRGVEGRKEVGDCPICGGWDDPEGGHAPDCALAAALAMAEWK